MKLLNIMNKNILLLYMTNSVSFLQIAGATPFSAFLGGGKRKKNQRKKTLKRKATKRKTIKRKKTNQRKKSVKRKTSKKSIKRVEKRTKRKSATKKKKCICDHNKSYSCNEPSPKGLGYCAHCTPLHVTMKGKDGNLWENVKFRNSRRWEKVRKDMMGGFLRPGTV